jgi:glycosyltransferase involved in cell wall biosynthesis
LEYGAAGLPVVSLEGRARQRFGEHLTYCVLDPSKIASAIDNAYDDGPSASLQHYVSDFDWHTIASTYADVIKSVV